MRRKQTNLIHLPHEGLRLQHGVASPIVRRRRNRFLRIPHRAIDGRHLLELYSGYQEGNIFNGIQRVS